MLGQRWVLHRECRDQVPTLAVYVWRYVYEWERDVHCVGVILFFAFKRGGLEGLFGCIHVKCGWDQRERLDCKSRILS